MLGLGYNEIFVCHPYTPNPTLIQIWLFYVTVHHDGCLLVFVSKNSHSMWQQEPEVTWLNAFMMHVVTS